MLPNKTVFCLFRQHEFNQLCRIRQPNPKLLRENLIINILLLHIYLLQYFDDFHKAGKYWPGRKMFKYNDNRSSNGFLNSFVLNMQITSFCFKNDHFIAQVEIRQKTFDNHINLALKTEKQDINYLNYNNALWDSFGFHIAQVGNILRN